MMNNDMLANIEYLREKADVSYEEAERILEQNDGNVMRALVELERQGRVYGQTKADDTAKRGWQQQNVGDCEGMKKTKTFLQKAFATRLVVEKNGGAEETLVANVPAPYAVVATVFAPWLMIGTGVVAIATGHNIRLEKNDDTGEDA